MGGLPLTKNDFRTHRAPMPPTHMTARPRRPYATPLKASYTTYAISAHDDAPRSTRCTRSQTTILDGNAPSRPDYRTAAHSGFAASAASAPPPLRTSPPPRSARLGSTTSTGRLASTSSTPTPPDLQSDSPPPTAPLHPTAPDPDIQAAATHLSSTLLNYSHSDWEQVHACPQPHRSCLQTRWPSFRVRRLPFNDSVRIYVPLLARPWTMHACHADASCHLGVMRTLKMLERFY